MSRDRSKPVRGPSRRSVRCRRAARGGLAWAASGIVVLKLCATPASAEEPYDLAPGDRVGVTVFEQPDLSGNYLVEPNGELTLPLVGSLDAASLTPKALQVEISNRLANGYLQNPVVSVRLSELRPVTVVGTVRGAGRFAFIDGMDVETALALAGGSVRVSGDEAVQRLDLLHAEERLQMLKLADLSQRARKARLEAQIKDAPTVELPGSDPQSADLQKSFVAAEQRTLDADRAAMASQVALLNQQVRTIQGDGQSFADQVDLEKQQVEIIDGELSDLGGLLLKGITRKSPVQDLQRERSKVQSNLARVLGELARSRSALAEVKLKVDDLASTYHNRLITELQAVATLLEQTKIGLLAAREELRLRAERLPFATIDDDRPPELRISRYVKGRMAVIPAEMGSALRPGDIVTVGHAPATRTPAPSSRLSDPAAGDPGRTGPNATSAVPRAEQLSNR